MNFTQVKSILLSIDDQVERLETVMGFGKLLGPVPENAKCTEIKGCSSSVSLCNVGNNFYGAADSLMVAGLVFIVISIVDGKSPAEIKEINILEELKSLEINMGTGRMMGLESMIHFLHNL